MAITELENAELAGTEFTPFNDTDQPRIEQAVLAADVVSGGMDTTLVDPYREGVNIRTARHRFNSTQPKLWAGNLNHYVTVRTIGQARSFTEFDNSAVFVDQPISVSNPTHPADFNPIQYIQDPEYPFPIIFNNGPQQEEEAIIEPFTIKFRRPSIEGQVTARSVKANLEDGNTFDSDQRAANRIEQFISFTPPNEPRFFLDEGEAYVGEVILDGILTERYDPVALYKLTSLNFQDTVGINPILVDAEATTASLGPGPFPNSITNPPAVFFDGASFSGAFLTSSVTLGAELPTKINGDLTAQCFFKFDGTGGAYLFAQSSDLFPGTPPDGNAFYALSFSTNFGGSVDYRHQYATGSNVDFSYPIGSAFLSGSWNHVAIVRTVTNNTASVTAYLNGVNLGTSSSVAPEGGKNTKFVVGKGDFTGGSARWRGGISSVKIDNQALGDVEIFLEAQRLLSPIRGFDNAVVLEGFTPLIQREVDPYNETKDERIVERIQTTDTDFISALKALKFDLDNDIREDFDRKSATAGNDVYGPEAGWTGTDSITYVGRTRGA